MIPGKIVGRTEAIKAMTNVDFFFNVVASSRNTL